MLIALGVWFHHFQLFSAAAHKLAEVSRRCTTGGWWSRGKTLLNLQTVHVVKLSQKLSSFAFLGGGRYQISLNFESLVYLCMLLFFGVEYPSSLTHQVLKFSSVNPHQSRCRWSRCRHHPGNGMAMGPEWFHVMDRRHWWQN